MIYLELFICYLKIGFFGFGGGYSMLSLIHNEVVVQKAWISSAALSDIIAVSQMTPGPIAINSATYIGYTVAGVWGSIIATMAVCLPSLTLMVIITRFFLRLKDNHYMECVMYAMKPAVIGMIIAAALLLILPSDESSANMIDGWSWLLYALAFFASVKKVNPIKLIILSAIAGIAIYYTPIFLEQRESKQAVEQWRGFDLCCEEATTSTEFEQEWVNYIFALQKVEPTKASSAIKATLSKTNDSTIEGLLHLSEKYLYNANSPMRNDELFIPVLEFVIEESTIDSMLKVRPKALLKRASRNRINTVASDLSFLTDNGMMSTIHSTEATYTLLYFNDPECADCERVSSIIEGSEELNTLSKSGELKILTIFASNNPAMDSLYDIKAVPTLYLLDEQKRVMLKDADVETIIATLASSEKL